MNDKPIVSGLIVFIENEQGDTYQVRLNQRQAKMVLELIAKMHEGTVSVHPQKVLVVAIENGGGVENANS